MANHTGVSGVVKVGSNVVAELRSFTIDTTAELIEDTTLTDTSRSYQFGKKGATVSAECWWDETDTNGQIAIIEGSQVALNLSQDEIKRLLVNSFKSSFLSEKRKKEWINKI